MPITDNPQFQDSARSGRLPSDWCGSVVIDGTKAPWTLAPIGSRYTRILAGSVAIFLKTASADADADWLNIATNVAHS